MSEDQERIGDDATSIPENWLHAITKILKTELNNSVDFHEPRLRHSFINNYIFFIVWYGLLVTTGTILNLSVILHIIKKKMYYDPTYCFIINLALSNLVMLLLVLPLSLTVMIIENWIYGQFLCFFTPMIQDFPLHVSMLTFLLIAIDRNRYMKDPTKPRIPAFVCATGTWLFAVCIVLPYPIYITYLDMGTYDPHLQGVGICICNLADDMKEYMRGLFLIMYVAPLGGIAYLYVQGSRELQDQDLAVMMFEARSRESRTGSHSTDCRAFSQDGGSSQFSYHSSSVTRRRYDLYEAELDVCKEKRNQKYLISMVTVFGICLCPLNVLKLARMAVNETYDNSRLIDITYVLAVWVGFLPTCTTPYIYASWQMSRSAKERLRGYFRFSNRRLRQSCEEVENSRVCGRQTVNSYLQRSSNVDSLYSEHGSTS